MVYYFTPFQIVYEVWDHDAIWEMLAEKNVYLRYVQVNVLKSVKKDDKERWWRATCNEIGRHGLNGFST